MDKFMKKLLTDERKYSAVDDFGLIKHLFGIQFAEGYVGAEEPHIKYELVKDLRSIFITAAIVAVNSGSDFVNNVKELMGFDEPIEPLLAEYLTRICLSNEVFSGRVTGSGDIALANILCREENQELITKIICDGYKIKSTAMKEPDRYDFNELVDSGFQDREEDLLFVRSVHVLNLQPYTALRSIPQVVIPYQKIVKELMDVDLYPLLCQTCYTEAVPGASYLTYRERVIQTLLSFNIEVVDSLMLKPKVASMCPVSISVDQLEAVILSCIIDKLVCIY